MFEKFGIKDAIGALWKYKVRIILGSILFAIFLTVVIKVMPDTSSQKVTVEVSDKNVVERVTANFYLKSNSTSSDGLTAEILGPMYLKAMASSECKLFVADYIVHGMGKAKVIEGLGGDLTEEQITTNFFSEYISYSLDGTKTSINVVSTSASKEFSNELVNAYLGYVQMIADNEDSQIKVVKLFKNEQQIEVVDGYEKLETPPTRISTKLLVLVTLLVSVIIMCIATFVVTLFRPTLNRRSDFENIGLNVIGEIVVDKGGLSNERKENS